LPSCSLAASLGACRSGCCSSCACAARSLPRCECRVTRKHTRAVVLTFKRFQTPTTIFKHLPTPKSSVQTLATPTVQTVFTRCHYCSNGCSNGCSNSVLRSWVRIHFARLYTCPTFDFQAAVTEINKEKSANRKWGVLEITWYKFQLQKVRFRGSIQAKYVFEHRYWCCSNTCLNSSQRGVQTFERLLGSRSNTLFEHCLNVKTTTLLRTTGETDPQATPGSSF